MTESRKATLLAIRAQAAAIAALAETLLEEPEPELEEECPHQKRLAISNEAGEKFFQCLDCGETFACPHDRAQDASTMGEPRRFCPDCGRIFEGSALDEIPE